jgi:hypothetical protein
VVTERKSVGEAAVFVGFDEYSGVKKFSHEPVTWGLKLELSELIDEDNRERAGGPLCLRH